MLTVKKAWTLVSKEFQSVMTTEVNLSDSLGHLLMEDLIADRDGPPFDRVMMDGIAISSHLLNQKRNFTIESIAKAGEPQVKLMNIENAVEVMTGAPLPNGCDTVIRYEDLKIENGIALVDPAVKSVIQNIHFRASDFKSQDRIVNKGSLIHAPMIGILASSGKSKVKVKKIPKIAIVSTGDELVDVDQTPLDHQIRRSNLYALDALLISFGFNSNEIVHLPDDKKLIFETLKKLLEKVDVLILSGGVSEGKYDYIPSALADLNVEKIFHNVSQRPGKPLWFGKKDQKIIFALPGNPVSCLVCLRRYFIEAFCGDKMISQASAKVILAEDVNVKGERVFFHPVKLKNNDGKILAFPIEGNGSGDYLTLKDSDGFVELDPAMNPFKKNQIVNYFSWKL